MINKKGTNVIDPNSCIEIPTTTSNPLISTTTVAPPLYVLQGDLQNCARATSIFFKCK